jgi:hypothetical protein
MTQAAAKAVMTLATSCLGENRRGWAFAMEGEFEAAIEDGKPLAFATGCLIAAWREMPKQAEGRLVLANYALALGLLIPMAVLQFMQAVGVTLTIGDNQNPYLAWSQLTAAPILLILWLLLGIGHLRLAWVLVERDWSGVMRVGALIGAAMVTLFLFMGVLFLDIDALLSQVAALAFELTAILATARGQARLLSSATIEVAVG